MIGMRISHIRPALFNFFNGTEIKIILNKLGGVEMGRPVLNLSHCHPYRLYPHLFHS